MQGGRSELHTQCSAEGAYLCINIQHDSPQGLYLTNDDDLSRLKLFSPHRLNIIAVYFSPGLSALIYCPHVYTVPFP